MTTTTLAPSTVSSSFEDANPDFTPWDDAQGDGAPAVESPPVARPDEPSSAVPLRCSLGFIRRLLEFVGWQPGWDGEAAEHVEISTALSAVETAQAMLEVAAEPFVAPAPSGSLLLQWDFADGTSVEVYVDGEAAFPEWAVLTREDVVHEVRLDGPGALRSLLERREPMPPAR